MGIVKQKSNTVSKSNVLKVGNVVYSLPTKPSEPKESMEEFIMLIYGQKKIGKTSLLSHFDNPLFLMFEPGGKSLKIYQESMTSWLKFTRFADLIVKDTKFKTIIIDPADLTYDACMHHVCKEMGIDHPADAGYGKGWEAVKKEFVKQIMKIAMSGKGLVFVSHQVEKKIELRDGKSYDFKTNTMSGQAKGVIEGLVDIWCNYDYDGRKRFLTILGDDFIDAGHRVDEVLPAFRYTNGKRVRRIDMGNSSKEGYDNFMKAFYNELQEPVEKKGGVIKGSAVKKKSY